MFHLMNFVVVNNQEYYVSTNLTLDRGWETLVFLSENQEVTDWGEVFGILYDTQEEAFKGHEEIVEKLQLYILFNF